MPRPTVEFELWSRQNWTNLDVVGESYRLKEIRRLFPRDLGPNDREYVGTAELVPEPTNKFDPNAVMVVAGGIHVGYLPKEVSASYFPALTALIGAGLSPITSCRIWGYEFEDYDVDTRGRETRRTRFEAQARIALDDPHLIVPVNLPPTVPNRMLPRGNSLQLKEEEKHLDILAPLVGSQSEAWAYGTLHAIQATSGRTEKLLVEIRIDDQPVGVLTPAMSQHFLPVLNHLAALGEVATARVLLRGNALKVEAVLYAARSHEIGAAWLSETDGAAPAPSSQASGSESPIEKVVPSEPEAVLNHLDAVRTVGDLATPIVIPPRPERIVFNPAPGWPSAPDGFEPGHGWQPLPEWPAPPADWQYWVTR